MRHCTGWLVVSACIAAFSAPSSGAPFIAMVVDTGGASGSIGAAIRPSSGPFHLRLDGTQFPPEPEKLGVNPRSAVDSFVALGGTSEQGIAPYFVINGRPFAPGVKATESPALSNVWFTPPVPADSIPGSNPVSRPAVSQASAAGTDTVFIARLVVDRGARPESTATWIGAKFGNEVVLAVATLDGPSFLELGDRQHPNRMGSRTLMLRSVLALQTDMENVGPVDVYDIYIVSEDAPPRSSSTGVTQRTPTKAPAVATIKTAKGAVKKVAKAPAKVVKKAKTSASQPGASTTVDDSRIAYGPSSAGTGVKTSGGSAAASDPLINQILRSLGAS